MKFSKRQGTLLLLSVAISLFSATGIALQISYRSTTPETTAAIAENSPNVTSLDYNTCIQCHNNPQQSLQKLVEKYRFPEDNWVSATSTKILINVIGILCLFVMTAGAHQHCPPRIKS